MPVLISYDLGTGGLKAGLYRVDGVSLGFEFFPYETFYPQTGWHEQRPLDWWNAFCVATKNLIRKGGIDPSEVLGVACSGHSLVAAPMSRAGKLLLDRVPIWSDRRATEEAASFFERIDYKKWYLTTGNGDPPETYSVFKLMWLKKHCPEVFEQTGFVLGSKDYLNYLLTGQVATDYSYASGSGVFNLAQWSYNQEFIAAAGIPRELFVEPVESSEPVGKVTPRASGLCGLSPGTKVFCGGVDNACMALGTTGLGSGRLYTSLGSSAWIAVSADRPILDPVKLPFVFAHVQKGYYTTGVSIFAAASAYRWARDTFCQDLSGDVYEQMNMLAAQSPVGANGVLFNPALAGGSSQEPSPAVNGAFLGLSLASSRADILRSILEGVALSLRCFCLSVMDGQIETNDTMILCGGGAKSDLWLQIFADVFDKKIARVNVDQDAASLGAAAIAARGIGIWQDYSPLDDLFFVQKLFSPIPENRDRYAVTAKLFSEWVHAMGALPGSPGLGSNFEERS